MKSYADDEPFLCPCCGANINTSDECPNCGELVNVDEDEIWEEAWRNNKEDCNMQEVKDKDNKLFIFVHTNKVDQQNFITEAINSNCFAQPVNFMILQAGKDIYSKKIYHQDKEITDLEEMKHLWNGVRPYLSISNANPDYIGNYSNWTYLESIIETGWKRQFSALV